jgi:hypothetical protein
MLQVTRLQAEVAAERDALVTQFRDVCLVPPEVDPLLGVPVQG